MGSILRQPQLFEVARTVVKYCDIEGNSMSPDIAVKKIIIKFDHNNNCIGTTVTLNPDGFANSKY